MFPEPKPGYTKSSERFTDFKYLFVTNIYPSLDALRQVLPYVPSTQVLGSFQ